MTLMARAAACFARRETRLTCHHMVNSLLSELDDYNWWTLAEAAGMPARARCSTWLRRRLGWLVLPGSRPGGREGRARGDHGTASIW